MPDRSPPKCAVCGRHVSACYEMCAEHYWEFRDRRKRPEWLKFLIRWEERRRYRLSHSHLPGADKREMSEVSLGAIEETCDNEKLFDQFCFGHGAFSDDQLQRNAENHVTILELLSRLTPEQRDIWLLRTVMEFSFRDIAKIQGIHRNSAWERYVRIKQRVAELMAEAETSGL